LSFNVCFGVGDGSNGFLFYLFLFILVSTKAQLGFSMPLFSHVFFCFVLSSTTITVGLSARPSSSLARFIFGFEFEFSLFFEFGVGNNGFGFGLLYYFGFGVGSRGFGIDIIFIHLFKNKLLAWNRFVHNINLSSF
jgi:hypothetical protein